MNDYSPPGVDMALGFGFFDDTGESSDSRAVEDAQRIEQATKQQRVADEQERSRTALLASNRETLYLIGAGLREIRALVDGPYYDDVLPPRFRRVVDIAELLQKLPSEIAYRLDPYASPFLDPAAERRIDVARAVISSTRPAPYRFTKPTQLRLLKMLLVFFGVLVFGALAGMMVLWGDPGPRIRTDDLLNKLLDDRQWVAVSSLPASQRMASDDGEAVDQGEDASPATDDAAPADDAASGDDGSAQAASDDAHRREPDRQAREEFDRLPASVKKAQGQ